MQTSREPTIQLAGAQQPITSIQQLTEGAVVTGVAMQHVWKVVATRDGDAWLQKLPQGPKCDPDAHTFEAYGRGRVCSRCQLRTQKLAEFLPRTEGKPRAYVIQPRGELLQPLPYTLYGTLNTSQRLETFWLADGAWNTQIPLISALHVLWTIPPALRTLLDGCPVAEELSYEGQGED